MKLIRVYIENFGGLHQYSLDLSDGLTVIEAPNGFGKTTLAEFIRAMFYGFPRKGKTLDKSRRQKYTPWNGGKFGGNLVFEVDGCQYRIERTFGATPKGDSFALIDLSTGRKSDRYTDEIGMELFQLDADSFERSTYMPQLADNTNLTTDSIRSKLTDLVEDTNDVGNFEKAIAALKAKRSTFLPYRGNGGSIMQAHSRVSQLQEQLNQTERLRSDLEDCENSIESLNHALESSKIRQEQLRSKIHLASEMAAVAAVHQHHDRLTGLLEEERAKCSRFRELYPNGIPETEQIDAAREAATQLEILNSQVITEQEDLDALAFLEDNHSRFGQHIPTEGELSHCREQCAARSALRKKILSLAAQAAEHPSVKANPLPTVLFLLCSVFSGVLGALLLQRIPLWGGIALGICGICLAGSVFAATRLASARKQLELFRQAQQEKREELDALSAEADKLSKEIEGFLGAYLPTDDADFYALLADLEHDCEDYRRAEKRVAQWQQEKATHSETVDHRCHQLAEFFARTGLAAAEDVKRQLLQIRDDRKDWEEAAQAIRELEAERNAFRAANSRQLTQSVCDAPERMDDLHRQEAELTREMSRISEELLRHRQKRDILDSQVRQIPDLRDELIAWQEKRTADQKKSDLLDDTVALLEQAKENLSSSYLGPIRSSFAGYLQKLWQQEQQPLITPDLDVQLERYGQLRELGYFSAGQTDTVMLCMRLALVDALFTAQKPFVILDDPFINLDDSRTAQALELLRSLANDRQILYLTCNSSRNPR